MDEAGVWKYLKAKLKDMRYLADRVENVVVPGYPDVSYVCDHHTGFMELKYLPAFPKRRSTTIKIPKFKPEQKLWLYTRGAVNGRCWLFIRVSNHYYLFSWDQVYQVEKWTKEEWAIHARGHWIGSVICKELNEALCDDFTPQVYT